MVSGSSPVKELAGSVVKCYESGERNIELRAIGVPVLIRCIRHLLPQEVFSHRKV